MSQKPTLVEDLRALEELRASKGWHLVNQVMREEIVQAAMAIAQNPNMSLDEINFRRGSIWAAKALLDLPEKLALKLSNELSLAKADDILATPPK